MGGGITACLISLLFASCVNSDYDGRTDTVYSLNTPSVTAKAYPGVNIVTWKPVSGAQSYKIYIYEENAYKHETVAWDDYIFYDTDLINGKNYKYYVEAVGKDNLPAREVYVTDSGRGEASARAIVPPAGTKSLDLPAYENGYDGSTKTTDSSDQYVVTSSNISASVVDGKVIVNFPMKAYLKYKVKYYSNDIEEKINSGESFPERYGLFSYDNNTTREVVYPIEDAGTYGIAIEAESWNEKYATSDPVVYNSQIKIDDLGINRPSIFYDSKARCIYFSPVTKENGDPVPLDWYKIYIHKYGDYTKYDEWSSESIIVKGDYYSENLMYYVDCSSLDSTTTYTVTVVVSDGKKYTGSNPCVISSSSSGTLNVGLPDSISAYYDKDYHSRVRVEFAQATQNGNPVPYNWYMIYRRDVSALSQPEQLNVTLNNSDDYINGKLYFYDDDVPDSSRFYEYIIIVTDGILKSEERVSNRAMPYFIESRDVEIETGYADDNVTLTVTCKSEASKDSEVTVYARYRFSRYQTNFTDDDFSYAYATYINMFDNSGEKKYVGSVSRNELNISETEEGYVYFYVEVGRSTFRAERKIEAKSFD